MKPLTCRVVVVLTLAAVGCRQSSAPADDPGTPAAAGQPADRSAFDKLVARHF